MTVFTMHDLGPLVLLAILSYLCGSIPFGYLLVKMFRGEDIRASGSGNIGATNVLRSGAKGLGIATLILDATKGALPVWFAWSVFMHLAVPSRIYFDPRILIVPGWAGLWAVLGHVFPIWLKFKGGKGVATALGVFAVLTPKAALLGLAVFVVVFALSRYVSLGSVLSAAALPAGAYWLHGLQYLPSLVIVIAISLLVIVKHHANIRRLLDGSEPRFGRKIETTDTGETLE